MTSVPLNRGMEVGAPERDRTEPCGPLIPSLADSAPTHSGYPKRILHDERAR